MDGLELTQSSGARGRLSHIARTIAVLGFALASALGAAEPPAFHLGIDTSGSVRTEWRRFTNRVASDIARLPDGASLRLVAFGARVEQAPLFEGVIDRAGREKVLRALQRLEPRSRWTDFRPVLMDGHAWLARRANGAGVLVLYSDGASSLPAKDLGDLSLLDVVHGRQTLELTDPTYLWDPRTGNYLRLDKTRVPGLPASASSIDDLVAALQQLQLREELGRMQPDPGAEAPTGIAFALASSLGSSGILWILGLAGLGSLAMVATRRALRDADSSWARNLPEGLRRPLLAARSAAETGAELDVEVRLPVDPRTVDHLEVVPPDGEAIAVPLPESAEETLTLTPRYEDALERPEVRWLEGLPGALQIRRGAGRPPFWVKNLGEWPLTVESPLGNRRPAGRGQEVQLFEDERIVLRGGWSLTAQRGAADLFGDSLTVAS